MATVSKTAASVIECPNKLIDDINNDVTITPVCQDVRIDNGVELSFTFSTALSTAEDAQLDIIIANLVCEVIAVQTTTDQITGTIYPVIFSYGSSTRNRWLSHPGQTSIPSNSTNAIIPFDSKLVGMVFSNKYNASVDIELHVAADTAGDTASKILTVPIIASRKMHKTNFPTEILFAAGDKLGIYCRRVGNSSYPNDTVVILYLQITKINNEERTENYTGHF